MRIVTGLLIAGAVVMTAGGTAWIKGRSTSPARVEQAAALPAPKAPAPKIDARMDAKADTKADAKTDAKADITASIPEPKPAVSPILKACAKTPFLRSRNW